MIPPLLSFLSSTRENTFSSSSTASNDLKAVTIVLGNTSCDLDSFISATVLSYFYTQNEGNKQFTPLLNLSDVPSSELWRLRPEFGTALRLAAKEPGDKEPKDDDEKNEIAKKLLGNLITITDLSEASSAPQISAFTQSFQAKQKQQTILVDHNAPAISGFSTADLTSRLELIGCIDHHVEESVIPKTASPRIIQTGIGSCASLVVQHLRDQEIWPTSQEYDLSQVAKLALAPILIDTFNLRAKGDKCSDIDRDAVKFLESQLTSAWDREAFFNALSDSKSNSLNLLTMPEIFERDYKEWTEKSKSSGKQINIGIPSLVKSLQWLLQKAGSAEKLVDAISHFARETDHDLSVVCLITKSSGPKGEFRKEIAAIAFGGDARSGLDRFEEKMSDELNLQEWKEDEELLKVMGNKLGKDSYRVWWQGDTEKSRKQVAPGLREAVRNA